MLAKKAAVGSAALLIERSPACRERGNGYTSVVPHRDGGGRKRAPTSFRGAPRSGMLTSNDHRSRTMPTITVNAEPRTFPDPLTVADLLRALGKDPAKLAVEVNRDVVPRAEHADRRLDGRRRGRDRHARRRRLGEPRSPIPPDGQAAEGRQVHLQSRASSPAPASTRATT